MLQTQSVLMRVTVAMALLAMLTLPVLGQERGGVLTGTITDQSKAVVPDVAVTVTNTATNRVFTTKTNDNGTFIAPDLEPGRYSVLFEKTGFAKFTVTDLQVLLGRTVRVDAAMQVGGLEQTVQVTGEALLIDTSRTSIAHNVTAEEFSRLPKARTFQSLALASPSVNAGEVEGGFQVNGASGAENQFNIDGVSTTSLINGKSRSDAVFEILQEVQVKTGGIDAEFGGALGGVISAVTKSGGNAFHGGLYYYFSGNAISAAPVLRLFADPVSEKAAKHFQDTKQTDRSHEIGGSLGGYFIKNKLYFFTAFSPRWRDREGTYKYSNGTETATNHRDNTYHQMFNKLSWDPVSRIRLNLSWLWSPTKQTGFLPGLNAYAPDTTVTSVAAMEPHRNIGNYSPQTNYTGQADITITPTALLTIRGGRFWDNYKTVGYPEVQNIQFLTSASSLPFTIPAALQQPKGYQNIPRGALTDYDIVTRTFLQTDFSKFGNFLGQHDIKGGWGYTKSVNRVLTREAYNGWIGIYWNSTSPYAPAGTAPGAYGYYEYNETGTAGSTGAGMHNLFIQDQWRVAKRLTLTLGFRTENERVPSVNRALKDYAFHFGFADKLAPRLGASFDIFGDGRIKVYGSWGRYFDWVKYELSRGSYGGDYWRVYYRTLDSPNVFTDLALVKPPNLPGTNVWRTSTFRNRRSNYIESVDTDVKPMSQDNMNVGVEYRIASQTVFRGNYVHNNLRTTIEDLGALDANGDEIYLHGNPGMGHALIMPTQGATEPFPMPKAIRKYDAMELSVNRRFSKGMFGSFSYVYSRLYGNYAGIASSDELTSPASGVSSRTAQQFGGSIARPGGNVNRAWDLDEVLFDAHGNVDIKGRLATDRPHVFKLYGNKEFNWKSNHTTDLGLFQYAGSGTPLTMVVQTVNQIPIMVEGRGNMGRTPFLTQTDFMIGHTVNFGETKRLRLEFNALNVLNQKTARNRFTSVNRGAGAGGGQPGSAIDLSSTDLFQGFDYRAMINASADQLSGRSAYDPLFGLSDIFNQGFAGRFGIKFTF